MYFTSSEEVISGGFKKKLEQSLFKLFKGNKSEFVKI